VGTNPGAESLRSTLTGVVAGLLDRAGAPGAAVVLIRDGALVLAEGIGSCDLGRTRPLDPDARFSVYSVAKIVLAVVALRLVEAGRLDLDSPIRAVLPELPLDRTVTVRRLLNHTSGLPDYTTMPEYHRDLRADPGAPWTTDEFLARTLSLGLLFPPGDGWAYSNVGFLLIGRAIERVTRRRLGAALRDLVFAPLGLRRTTVAETLDDTRDLTPGYSDGLDRDGGLHDIARRYHPGWVAHGLVLSTAPEVARVLDAVFDGRLLGSDLVSAMLDAVAVPETHELIAKPGYGLGLMVDLGSPHGLVAGHGGEGPGYSTAAFHFPDAGGHRLTSVALTNRDAHDLGVRVAFALATAHAEANRMSR